MSQPPPLGNARQYVFELGFHFVSSSSSGCIQHTLGHLIEVAESRKNDNKNEPGEYMLMTADPAPEVMVHNKIAAVWAAIKRTDSDGRVAFRSYATFFLMRLDNEPWKISGFAHAHPEALAPLPAIGNKLTPEVERLLHFPDEMLKARNLDVLPEWIMPGARMVRHRLPEPPTAAPVEDFVRQLMTWAIALPADTKWQETFEDVTVRTAGDLGFLWMKFNTTLIGKALSSGIDLLVIHWQNGRWLFGGTQTFSIPAKKLESVHP